MVYSVTLDRGFRGVVLRNEDAIEVRIWNLIIVGIAVIGQLCCKKNRRQFPPFLSSFIVRNFSLPSNRNQSNKNISNLTFIDCLQDSRHHHWRILRKSSFNLIMLSLVEIKIVLPTGSPFKVDIHASWPPYRLQTRQLLVARLERPNINPKDKTQITIQACQG